MYETPEGFLVCVGVPIARTGNQLYADGETPLEVGPDGTVSVYRDEKEVFRAETIASFQGKSITIGHPQEFVNPTNWKMLSKGIIQNVRRGEGDQKNDLLSDIVITDHEAISKVRGGLREVSCGYEAEYEQTEPGMGAQKNIIGNHLALVEEARAGSSYAINDHKGAGTMLTLKERIAAMFGKAQDEAIKLIEAESKNSKVTDEDKPDDKKDDKKESKDAGAYDELVQICKDLSAKVDAMAGKKADDAEPEQKPEEKKVADDDLPGRISKLEDAVSQLLKGKSDDAEPDDEEKSEDAQDDDFEETTMVGDSAEVASRAEIIAPGIKIGKDLHAVRVNALKTAYATDEGKKLINKLTGNKAPAYDSVERVDMVFTATAELFKAQRNGKMAKTKTKTEDFDSVDVGVMTAEKMNEINNKHYSNQK